MQSKPRSPDIGYLRSLIEEVKRQRIEEAKKLGLCEKAMKVAKVFGKYVPKLHGYLWVYPPEAVKVDSRSFRIDVDGFELVIVYDDYGNNVDVYHSSRKVLDAHLNDVDLYIPGRWVEELNRLYEKAREVEESRDREEVLKKLMEEARLWAIEIPGS